MNTSIYRTTPNRCPDCKRPVSEGVCTPCLNYRMDGGIVDDFVVVKCPRCSASITLAYDSGEPQTWEHPGTPGEWYTPDPDQCPHLDTLTDEEWSTMQARAEDLVQ